MTGPRLSYTPEYKKTRAIKMLNEGFSHKDIHMILKLSLNFISALRREIGMAKVKRGPK